MEFQILGPVQVWAAGRSFAVGEPRQQALLAALLVDAGRPVSVDTLVDRVWGDAPPPQARRSLQAHVARIRRALERAAEAESAMHQLLVRSFGGYTMDLDRFQIDALRFRDLVARARSADVDEHRRASSLREALSLWRGEPLSGVGGGWADRMRLMWQQEHLEATVMWARAEIRLGNAWVALAPLTTIVEEHPMLESAAATLMLALYAAGRPSDALERYEVIRRRLREEWGADPGAELRAAHQGVLRHDTAVLAAGPAGALPVPAQLPLDVSSFTGRTAELAELDDLLAESAIVCLTGSAGVGKTALAVRWGHRVRDRFPDGQLYVDLRGYDPDQPVDPADALASFLSVLVTGGTPIPLDRDERAARYRTAIAGRRMLIVLDNAATVDQIRPLLPGTAGCTVVATSRDSLAGLVSVHGARRVAVDLLPPDDAVELLRRLIGPRIDAEPVAAAALADRCARLPLALRVAAEIAVSRPAVGLSELVSELREQRGLDLLSESGDGRAAVRSVFSWSIRHLSAPAAGTFVLLGLHPGPYFDSRAVAALVGGDHDAVRRTLDALARAHLVCRIGVDRYGMHDLLRAYATDLATGPTSDRRVNARGALSRLYDYYLAAAALAMRRLHPGEANRKPLAPDQDTPLPDFADPTAARVWLDIELDNLVAIAAHASPSHTVRLAVVLDRYLDGGRDTAALTVHRYARDAARSTGDLAAEAGALSSLGATYAQAGRHAAAAEHLHQALALTRRLGDPVGEARALGNLGMVEERLGRYGSAAEQYRHAATQYQRAEDSVGEAHALTRLGTMQARLGHTAAATEHLGRALTLHRRLGHRFGEGWALIGIGEVMARTGQPAAAAERHRDALALFRELGHRTSEGWALDSLGIAENLLGRHAEASRHHRKALDLFHELGEAAGEARSLNGLGEAAAATGRLADARAHHGDALALAERIGAGDQRARAHAGLARASIAAGEPHAAGNHYRQAMDVYAGLNDTGTVADIRIELMKLQAAVRLRLVPPPALSSGLRTRS